MLYTSWTPSHPQPLRLDHPLISTHVMYALPLMLMEEIPQTDWLTGTWLTDIWLSDSSIHVCLYSHYLHSKYSPWILWITVISLELIIVIIIMGKSNISKMGLFSQVIPMLPWHPKVVKLQIIVNIDYNTIFIDYTDYKCTIIDMNLKILVIYDNKL